MQGRVRQWMGTWEKAERSYSLLLFNSIIEAPFHVTGRTLEAWTLVSKVSCDAGHAFCSEPLPPAPLREVEDTGLFCQAGGESTTA